MVFCLESFLQGLNSAGQVKEILKDYKVYPEWGIFLQFTQKEDICQLRLQVIEHLKYII